jgi:hypothetical protein
VTGLGDLCERHGYPRALRDVLEALVGSARTEIPGLCALVLSGSVATGDFVWRGGGSSVRLLSDIDVFAFAQRGGPRPGFSVAVERLERSQASALFHIDVSISPVSALRKLPRRFQFVEAGLAGVAPIGAEVLASFPRHFDPRAARQSFFGNVWKGILCWPGPAAREDETYRLALARMILDLPILAFSERGRCIPGHTARAEAFLALDESHPLVGATTRRAVDLALRMRRSGDVARRDLEDLVPVVVDALLDFLDGGGPTGSADWALARRIGRLLPPRTPRRLAGELRAVLRDPGMLWRDPGWWSRRKEAAGGAALVGLLRFALDGAVGPPPTGLSPLLRAFTGGGAPDGEGAAYLAEACRLYWEGRCRLYPSDAQKGRDVGALLGARTTGKASGT